MNSEWLEQRNCKGVDPNLFFPERGADQSAAKAICRACVVKEICLEENLGAVGGIYGGKSDRERRKLRVARSRLTLVEPDLLD